MYLILRIFLKKAHRIVTGLLLSGILLFSLAWGGQDYNFAFADVLERDATTLQDKISTDKVEYESAKTRRREAQAKRSEQASEKNKNESAAEKLNLDELTTGSDNKFSGQEKQ